VSKDRGKTWRSACLDDVPLTDFRESPAVSFNAEGQLLALSSHNDQGQGNTVLLHTSTDGGKTWPFAGEPFQAYYTAGGVSYLNLSLDAGPKSAYRGRLYTPVRDVARYDPYTRVRVARSTNGGATWQVAQASPQYDFLEGDIVDAPDLAIGRRGTLYLSYSLCASLDDYACQFTPFDVLLVTSADGGSTWSAPRPVQKMTAAPVMKGSELALPNADATLEYRPVLAVDASSGAHAGRLYSLVTHYAGGRLQIMLSQSDDGGASWSTPQRWRLSPASSTSSCPR
jgi:hypothetical protein